MSIENHSQSSELLAGYSEDAMPTGQGIPRGFAHRAGILHGASHVYIRKWEQGRLWFLLQRRSRNKDSFPGCLDVSSAGHVELGSDFLQTALRELHEELGLKVSADALRALFDQRVEQREIFWGEPFLDCEINRIYLLLSVPEPGELRLQTEELSEVLWLPAEEILFALHRNDPEYCLNLTEFQKVVNSITETEGSVAK